MITDGLFELGGAAMSPAANLPLGERGEPALDLIEAGEGCRGQVRMETRMAGHPALTDGVLWVP